jgi:hypothetical protein
MSRRNPGAAVLLLPLLCLSDPRDKHPLLHMFYLYAAFVVIGAAVLIGCAYWTHPEDKKHAND